MRTARPYLLVDVDFVLNPDFRGAWDGPHGEQLREDGWVVIADFIFNGRPVWLNRFHGIKLLHAADATGAKLAWATSWYDLANQVISPLLGLPQMPVAPSPPGRKPDEVIPWTGGRQFAWLDDEEYVVKAACATPGGHGVKIDPAAGLTDSGISDAVAFLRERAG